MSQVCSGLRFRLLALVVLVCAPLVAPILHTTWEDRRRAEGGWQQHAQKLTEAAERQEQEVLSSSRQLLLALSESASVRSLNPRRCQKSLDEWFAINRRYANLGVLSTNGEVLASALPIASPGNRSNHYFFRRTLETRAFTIGKFPYGPTNSAPALRFGYPMLDSRGQVLAVVFAELDLAWFSSFASSCRRNCLRKPPGPRLIVAARSWRAARNPAAALASRGRRRSCCQPFSASPVALWRPSTATEQLVSMRSTPDTAAWPAATQLVCWGFRGRRCLPRRTGPCAKTSHGWVWLRASPWHWAGSAANCSSCARFGRWSTRPRVWPRATSAHGRGCAPAAMNWAN